MSMKRLGALSPAGLSNHGKLNNTVMNPSSGSPNAPIHGVNVMLGGAMLSGIILVVFVLCYCCHKKGRKPSDTYLPYYWRDPTMSLEAYTVESQNRFVTEDIPVYEIRVPAPAPPPPYESVVSSPKSASLPEGKTINADETGLPSYEAATRFKVSGSGYF